MQSADCPASVIHFDPESKRIARLLEENRMIREATGATLLGSDSSNWPAWWGQAVVLHQRYTEMEKGMFHEAALREMERR